MHILLKELKQIINNVILKRGLSCSKSRLVLCFSKIGTTEYEAIITFKTQISLDKGKSY